MKDFQAKRKKKRLLYSWWTVAVLALLNIFIVKANWQLYGKERYTHKNMIEAKKEAEDLEKRELELQASVSNLRSAEGIDLELRRKFQVVKPGESVVVIVPPGAATSAPDTLEEKPSLWQNFVGFFGL